MKPQPAPDTIRAADVARAADAIRAADALIIGAGAGMGVDSGMPDFRSANGFWGNYPLLNGQRIDVLSMCNPDWFRNDPTFAWGFYGHRLQMYRRTSPHDGYAILKRWSARMRRGAFVYTSNIDGHFQKAGFAPSSIFEVHGSLHWLQCMDDCGVGIFSADAVQLDIDESSLRARGALPKCRACGALARPNIVLYGDDGFDAARIQAQLDGLERWMLGRKGKTRVVVVECGAGSTIPTVRDFCEEAAQNTDGTLIRINKSEAWGPQGALLFEAGAKDALTAIDAALDARAT